MPAEHKKPDQGLMNGIGRAMKSAFAPDSPIDPELVKLIRKADGKYIPDEAADERVNNLLDRLIRLPWDQQGATNV